MSMQILANFNNKYAGVPLSYTSDVNKGKKLSKNAIKQPEASKHVKRGVFLTTALGVATGVAIALKRGKCIKDPKLISGKLKFLNPLMKVDYDWKNVIIMAGCSILGGITGGAIFDKKENFKAKCREGIIQMGGNILIPLGCVGGGSALYDKFLAQKVINKFKLAGPKAEIPGAIIALITLSAAIFFGNKTTNFINEEIYHIRDDRGVKFADMSGHLDDTCLALSKASKDSVISKVASRVIPLALLVCGYSSGVMQEWPPEARIARKVDSKIKKHDK